MAAALQYRQRHLDRFSELQDSYDRIADEYCKRIFDEPAHKPLDRQLLQRLANTVKSGPICDVGCGPGHVARFLKSCEADVFGIDLSPRMIELAQRLTPEIQFFQGNMLSLEGADDSCGGIAAVLRPGGTLLLAFHVGKETVHEDELWGYQVSLDFKVLGIEGDRRAVACHRLSCAGDNRERNIRRRRGVPEPARIHFR
ncbi:MAG: class I SAM-dependent methyltransferase [Acidobacteria bacterium]|nr:MAG: class I SAM-dependent methyltransferase [Acidobacteriota bacterium]